MDYYYFSINHAIFEICIGLYIEKWCQFGFKMMPMCFYVLAILIYIFHLYFTMSKCNYDFHEIFFDIFNIRHAPIFGLKLTSLWSVDSHLLVQLILNFVAHIRG